MLFKKNHFNFNYFPSIKLPNFSTPYFVIDKNIVDKRLSDLHNLLNQYWGENHKIAFSFKTNYELAKNYQFDLAEVVSQNELSIALSLKYSNSKTIFNGPFKGDLNQLQNNKIIINIDNFSEIEQLKSPPLAEIGLRLNTKYQKSRFGFNINNGEANTALTKLSSKRISLSGIHFHAGSDIQNPKIYLQASQEISDFITKNSLQKKIKYIDFGGGFPSHGIISGKNIQSSPNYPLFIKSIISPLKKIFADRLPLLILEPGRYLVDDATFFVTKVIDKKNDLSTQNVTVDSTINMLPLTWYHQNLIKKYDSHETSMIDTIIYGCSCQESDILYKGKFTNLQIGDYLIFYCVGAYNQSQSSSFIFSIPPTYFIQSNDKIIL